MKRKIRDVHSSSSETDEDENIYTKMMKCLPNPPSPQINFSPGSQRVKSSIQNMSEHQIENLNDDSLSPILINNERETVTPSTSNIRTISFTDRQSFQSKRSKSGQSSVMHSENTSMFFLLCILLLNTLDYFGGFYTCIFYV